MLKDRVKELIDRYEEGEENLTPSDVQEELENILTDEPYDSANLKLEMDLQDALRDYIIAQHDAERGGGRIPDGGDEFIAAVERIIGYND